MNKNVSLIIIGALVIALFIIFSGGEKQGVALRNNVEIRNNIQYVTIDAGRGYSPRVSTAQAGVPTKLIMRSAGAFDCSSALTIPSLKYQKMLPPTGETEIDIGIWKKGETMQGLCSMGMYNFQIKFN